jgi:hypothetical protein
LIDETWHAARLIPTSGITGPDEQERRVVSALLAVMGAVKEFGRAVTAPLGAPSGHVSAFIEVPFTVNGDKYRPDGLLSVSRGKKNWTCLVEVKTSKNCLEPKQVEAYLDIAREQGFDAVLTISNELPAIPGVHPTAVDGRKTRKVSLHHLSWTEIHTIAVVQEAHHGVADPEQAWILSELIRYLEHPRSGAMEFHDMGPSWVPCRQAIAEGTLRSSDKDALGVATRWEQLTRFLCLQLGRQIGREVEPVLTRKELSDPSLRSHSLATSLAEHGTISASIEIPNAAGRVFLEADMRTGKIRASLEVDAPQEGKPPTRVKWLTRQLNAAPDDLRIDAMAFHERSGGTSELLRDVRIDPQILITDPKRELKSFRVSMSASMGTKRGDGGFVNSMTKLLDTFYESVIQSVRPWVSAPLKLRNESPDSKLPLTSSSLSSQDGREADENSSGPIGVLSAKEATSPRT